MGETKLGPIGHEIHRRIVAALAPERVEVIDESAAHAGHAGHDARGESHFRVVVVSAALAGLGRVERVRAVQRAVGDLVTGGRVHALSVDARAA